MPFCAISAVTGEGLEPLKYAIAKMVEEHRPVLDPSALEPAAKKIKPAYPPPAPKAKGRAH